MVWPKGQIRKFVCTVCEKEYTEIAVRSNFCDKCRKRIPVLTPPDKKPFEECERLITPRQSNQIYCSPICKNRDYNREHDIPGMMRKIREQGEKTLIAKLKKTRVRKKAAVS